VIKYVIGYRDNMMNLAEEALARLSTHEAKCEERLRRLDEKLDLAHRDISTNRNAVFALYPFIVGAVFLADWFK
jgi:hypothetical protein